MSAKQRTTTFQGKTALVTGGAVRIGRAICEALAAAGCNIVVQYRRSVKEADRLAEALARRRGVRALTIQSDLMTERSCVELIDDAWTQAGALDILINNAAVFHKDPLAACTADKVQADFQLNLFAPIYLVREFAARARTGQVINLLDRRIASHETGCVPYLLSKQSLAEFTRLAALELAPRIRVNGVAPGAVLPPPGKGADYLRDHAGRVPLERRVTPADIAEAVLVLLKLDAVTGQVLYVDGGQHLLGNGV